MKTTVSIIQHPYMNTHCAVSIKFCSQVKCVFPIISRRQDEEIICKSALDFIFNVEQHLHILFILHGGRI